MTGVSVGAEGFIVDAAILAEAFALPPAEVSGRMRAGLIVSRQEKGIGADAGRHRLTFYHDGRALRLTVDDTGRILSRAMFDAKPAAGKPRRPGGNFAIG